MPSIIFMGTPEFAVPSLEALHREFGVRVVVTVPDKPKGRGKKLQASPVKQKAAELGLKVLQPESLNDVEFIRHITDCKPDIMVVVAFRILPTAVYEQAKIGAFNIHGSLLPKYRGAAPINWAIINGEKVSGLTSFLLQQKVDTGNILLQKTIPIPEDATAGDYHDSLMSEAAKMSVDTCKLLISGDYKAWQQDNSEATPAPKIFRDTCRIQWAQHARDLKNFIHGVSPIPGAWTEWDGKILKILRVQFSACGRGTPGKFKIENGNMFVLCNKGLLSIVELQVQGKRAMNIIDFLAGYRGEREGMLG